MATSRRGQTSSKKTAVKVGRRKPLVEPGPKSRKSGKKKTAPQLDPTRTVVLIGEDGRFYKLNRDEWMRDEYVVDFANDTQAQGVVNQLKEFGSYLAFVPTDIAVGIGWYCTVVNIQSILKNQEAVATAVVRSAQPSALPNAASVPVGAPSRRQRRIG